MKICCIRQIIDHLIGAYVRPCNCHVTIGKGWPNSDPLFKYEQYTRLQICVKLRIYEICSSWTSCIAMTCFWTSLTKFHIVSTVNWSWSRYRFDNETRCCSCPQPIFPVNVSKHCRKGRNGTPVTGIEYGKVICLEKRATRRLVLLNICGHSIKGQNMDRGRNFKPSP